MWLHVASGGVLPLVSCIGWRGLGGPVARGLLGVVCAWSWWLGFDWGACELVGAFVGAGWPGCPDWLWFSCRVGGV